MKAHILVVGCGGIGGIVTAALAEHDPEVVAEVTALTTNHTIARRVEDAGLRLTGEDGERTVRARLVTELPPEARYDWVLLAVQPPQVEEAARRALPHLADGGAMVCFQNGLCESRVMRVTGLPVERVIGAIIAWGAAMPEPGLYERTSAGGFTIGRWDGAHDDRLGELGLLLEPIGPVAETQNLVGARWSKLALNCAVLTLGTLAGMRLGAIVVHRFVRRLALEIMTETVAVARAEAVRLEKVAGTMDLGWIALTDAEKRAVGSAGLVAKHAMILAVGARYRRMRSSMLAAIERGRTPAVDFLNGEVAERGRAHGIATPVNAEAQRLVHALARREERAGMALLRKLADVAALS